MVNRSDDVLHACTRAVRDALRDAGIRDRRGHPGHREIAIRQAADMEAQRLVGDALRRERDQALAGREAALDLAAQYAERLGVDLKRDEALRYAAQYWEQRARFEQRWHLLEGQRWDTLAVARDLERVAAGELRLTGVHDLASMAGVIAKELTRLHAGQGPKRRAANLFARPDAPGIA